MKKYFTWIATLGWALLIWRLTTTAQIVVTEEFLLQNILMMGAHFTFFGIGQFEGYFVVQSFGG